MTRLPAEDVHKKPGALHVFAPVTNGDKLNFYGLAVAPEIRWIRNATNQLDARDAYKIFTTDQH